VRTLMMILAALSGLLAFSIAARADTQPVTFLPANQVQAAFEKGQTLYSGPVNYRVEASRRDHPGLVEIHTGDTDIIYVLDGTSTFVTGGQIADAKAIAPGEIRGVSTSGGQVYHLAKGDVIIVPAGTPHWFKEVAAPFIYYVVKVR